MLFDKSLLQQVLTAYKAVFVSKQWPEEKYKWVAVKHFQDNWDIDAPDFAAMLKNALAKTGNLLVSVNNFPARMITEFAEVAPEQVRAMFKELFDETLDIWQRVKSFKEKSQPLLDIHGKNAKNHYQGENTIFTYLWLRYPEKYYIYKISELKTVAETLRSNLVFQNGKYEDNIRNFLKLYNAIRLELLKDDELKTLLKSQLTDDCYADEALCTLTVDFGFYISRRYEQESDNENDNASWFPTDYTPGFSVEDWVKLLKDPEVFTTSNLEIMARFQDFGGVATCKQLSDKYGESANFYNSGSSYLAKRIHEKTNCPVMAENTENSRWWPILYRGRYNEDKNVSGVYIWKLRPELVEALKQVDLSAVKLYADFKPTIWKISHGPGVISEEEYTTFEKNKVAVVHGITGAKGKEKETQGEKFIHKIQKGDYFYLCRGNSIRLLGQFDSDKAVINPEKQDDWYQRSYKVIAVSKNAEPYKGPQKWWTPNNNSTCYNVDDNKDFEENILKPYFKLTLADLGQNNTETMRNPMIKDLKELLLSAKQIILTGAPGTGKTYLAKQVAYALTGDNPENCPHIEFCQFHPSFDYTDFVEGLRPVDKGNGNIGFERKDGIFKAFCKKAIGKSVNNFDEAYNKFSEFLSENYSKSSPLELKTPNNASFRVFLNTKGSLSLLTGQKNEVQGSLTSEKIKTFLTEKPYEFWAGYYLGVIDYLKKNFNLTSIADNNEQKYVFIIDEINRGDISKIFGELFYAVDPGYRGQDGKVKTQYSNLISDDDPYHGGFYIPQNVYIIGTMNDIDRSVESMDFAIRRRFTWKEIKAQDRVDMWDGKIDQWKADAGKRMNELNAAISLTDSLNDAFHIGPAYFLKLSEKGYNFETLWDLHIQPLLKEYLRGTVNQKNDLARLQDAYNLKFIEKTPEIAEQPATES